LYNVEDRFKLRSKAAANYTLSEFAILVGLQAMKTKCESFCSNDAGTHTRQN